MGRILEWLGTSFGRGGATGFMQDLQHSDCIVAARRVHRAEQADHDVHSGPFVFVGSAATAAGGLGMVTAPVSEAGPARRAAVLGAALELSAMNRMERGMGLAAEPLRVGRAGRLLRAAVVGGLLGRRSRTAAVLGGLAGLAGSACTRFGGVQSAEDPKYTVEPQRRQRDGS